MFIYFCLLYWLLLVYLFASPAQCYETVRQLKPPIHENVPVVKSKSKKENMTDRGEKMHKGIVSPGTMTKPIPSVASGYSVFV
jgi:hypothetical protein